MIPRIRGGVVTADQLRRIADAADKYELPMIKITGGQRIDLLGARKEQLPAIWEDLGMPSGHAYAKAVRTVKTCVGSEFCRFGLGDAITTGIDLERAMEGLHTPHKVKAAVSGCPRNCAESYVKDIGIVAVEGGWEIYVGGAAGASVRKGDLLTQVAERRRRPARRARVLAALPRAGRAPRAHLRLPGARRASRRSRRSCSILMSSARCWSASRSPRPRAIPTRGVSATRRRIPSSSPSWTPRPMGSTSSRWREARVMSDWIRIGATADVPLLEGRAVTVGDRRVAIFRLPDGWAAVDAACPHRGGPLQDGLVADSCVTCPLHGRRFDLRSGAQLGRDR